LAQAIERTKPTAPSSSHKGKEVTDRTITYEP
jgi:hypothetical protein